GARDGAEQGDRDGERAGTYLREQRSRASAGHRPTQTKEQASVDLALIELFRLEPDRLAVDGPELKPLDQPHGDHPHDNGRADHPIHVKALQPEHLLDAEPGYDLRLYERDPEQDAHDKVLCVVIPLVLQVG